MVAQRPPTVKVWWVFCVRRGRCGWKGRGDANSREGVQNLLEGRPREGQWVLGQLLKAELIDAEVLYNLGICYSGQGMIKESEYSRGHSIT
jgi:hypothetical protein